MYEYVNKLQPQCLISFKTGYTGDEDFLAPEWTQVKFDSDNNPVFNIDVPADGGLSVYNEAQSRLVLRKGKNGNVYKKQYFKDVWHNELSKKPVELCNPILKKQEWFDVKDGVHKTVDEIQKEYEYARSHNANYLLSIGLRGDGSVHPKDSKTLRAFGKRLKHYQK